jgi:hypothetical protein
VVVLAPAYRPRRPSECVLYGVVREHLETFFARAIATGASAGPRFVVILSRLSLHAVTGSAASGR